MEFTSVVIVASRPTVVGVQKVGVDLLHFAFDPETAEEELSFCFGGMGENQWWCDCQCDF